MTDTASGGPVRVEYTITENDLVAFSQRVQRNNARARWPILVIVLALAFVMLVAMIALQTGDLRQAVMPAIVLAVLWSALLLLFRRRFTRNVHAKVVHKTYGDHAMLRETHAMEVRDDGLWFVSDSGASLLRWPAIFSIEESEDQVFIFTARNVAHIVPRKTVLAGDLAAAVVEIRRRMEAAKAGQGAGATAQ